MIYGTTMVFMLIPWILGGRIERWLISHCGRRFELRDYTVSVNRSKVAGLPKEATT